MIGYLLSLLFLLFTPIGFLAFATGVVLFLLLPVVPRATNRFHIFGRLHLWLGAQTMGRIAVVVTEHGDALLKQLIPDDIGTEKIAFNDDVKEFEDTHQAKSSWLGVPFALADEVHGVLFDPIDAALGRRKKELEEENEMVAKATPQERDMYDVQGWVHGVLEFPAGVHELVDLSDARRLIMGTERAEHPHRIKEYYKKSQDPYGDSSAAGQFMLLLAAITGPFVALWVLASQLGTGTGGGGSTVSFGALLLLGGSLISLRTVKTAAVALFIALPFALVFMLLTALAGPIYAVSVFVLLGAGFWFVPILSQFLRLNATASEAITKVYFKLGLLGYDTPIFELTPSGYKMREFKNLDAVDEETISWHRFLGRDRVGFTFAPYPEVWGTEVVDTDEVEQRSVDRQTQSNVPAGYSIVPDITRAVYGLFVPKTLRPDSYYVATDISFGRFANAARGKKSDKRFAKSKEDYGGGTKAVSTKAMVYGMSICGAMSLLLGIGVFFLL